MYEETARLVDVMHRDHYAHLRGNFVDYPIVGNPIRVGNSSMEAFENFTIDVGKNNEWKYGFVWNGDIYLIPESPIETGITLYGDKGAHYASKAFATIGKACDSPTVAGKGVVLNERLLSMFRDRFDNINDLQFWLDDIYREPFQNKHGCRHCSYEVMGAKLWDCGKVRNYPLEITGRGSFGGSYPLLILAKLPFDTMVYTDGEEGKPLRIVPEGCLREPK